MCNSQWEPLNVSQAFFHQSIYSSSHLCIYTSSFFQSSITCIPYTQKQLSIVVKGLGGWVGKVVRLRIPALDGLDDLEGERIGLF